MFTSARRPGLYALVVTIIIGGAALKAPGLEPVRAVGVARPNVLLIITDDQRAGTMGWMPETSRLMKSEGTNFTRAFSTTPLCCPARASIMTGRYVHNHGVKYFRPYLLDQTTTVQRYLKDAGYRTGYFGKYLNAWSLEDDPPYFDEWAIFPQSRESTYMGGRWNVDGSVQEVTDYSTRFLLGETMEFLEGSETNDDAPWMMYVSTPAAHTPFTAEPKYANEEPAPWKGNPAVFERDLSDKPPYVQGSLQEKRCTITCGRDIRSGQYRSLLSVDDLVANVFDVMRRLGESRTTLAIFVSDNGLMWGEHGLRGKRVPYTPSSRIPLIVHWPGVIEESNESRLATNVDIAPTILSAAGIPQDASVPMDGRPLLSSFSRRSVLLEHWRGGGPRRYSTIQTATFQYTEYYAETGDPITFREYYNLRSDPYQLTNLLKDGQAGTGPDSDRLRRLHHRLRRLKDCAGASCP